MTSAQEKFEKASDKFLNSLKNLEEVTLSKVNEVSKNKLTNNIEDTDANRLKNKVIEQESIINNLGEELNNIQKTMKEIGKENDFLKDKNRFFADKVFKFKTQGSKIIQSVESDLDKIREIVKNEQL